MSCERIQGLLHDHLDGELAAEAREAVDRHLAGCVACRRERDALEALRERARSLPRGIDPGRDLWPGVAARLAPRSRWRALFELPTARPVWLAAAAALVVAVGLSLALLVEPDRPSAGTELEVATAPPAARELPAELAARASLARREDGTQHSRTDLEVTVEMQRDLLSEEVLADLEQNMRILDTAVAELRSALDEDPWNRRLSHLLAARYQQEAEIAQRVQRI